MEIQTVSGMFGVRAKPEDDDFALMVFKQRVPITELPLYQAMNGDESLSMICVDGSYETTKKDELERLHKIFRLELVDATYPPTPMTKLPTEIGHVELTRDQMGNLLSRDVSEAPPMSPEEQKAALMLELEAVVTELDEVMPDMVDRLGPAGLTELIADAKTRLKPAPKTKTKVA